MNSRVLFSSLAILASIGGIANAYDFNDKVYGKAEFSVGYSAQLMRSNDLEEKKLQEAERWHNVINRDFHVLSINLGYNFYFKANKTLHPFVGLDFQGRIPLKNDIYIRNNGGDVLLFEGEPDEYLYHIDPSEWNKGYWRIADFLSLHFKFGTKVNIFDGFSINPYGLIGANIIKSSTIAIKDNNTDTRAGLSTGAGIAGVYDISKDLSLLFAIEYQYHCVNNIKDENSLMGFVNEDGIMETYKYVSHQIGVRFGIQFL